MPKKELKGASITPACIILFGCYAWLKTSLFWKHLQTQQLVMKISIYNTPLFGV